MTPSQPSPTRARPTRSTGYAAVLLLAAAVAAVVAFSPVGLDLGHEARASADRRPSPGLASAPRVSTGRAGTTVADPAGRRRGIPTSVPGEGVTGAGGTVFDDGSPTVSRLDPALLEALRAAATEAGADGITFHVNSGWRSAAEQERLLQQAIARYGSEKEARRWVATPQTSAHVSGDAVDLGPSEAARWLARHGAAYGLCQVYRNEPWHFELRQGVALNGCPAMYADPTQDPRMTR